MFGLTEIQEQSVGKQNTLAEGFLQGKMNFLFHLARLRIPICLIASWHSIPVTSEWPRPSGHHYWSQNQLMSVIWRKILSSCENKMVWLLNVKGFDLVVNVMASFKRRKPSDFPFHVISVVFQSWCLCWLFRFQFSLEFFIPTQVVSSPIAWRRSGALHIPE